MLAWFVVVSVSVVQGFTIAPSNSPRNKGKAFDKQSSSSSSSGAQQQQQQGRKVARYVPNGQQNSSQAAALAAFAAAMAPLAANAGEVAEVDGKSLYQKIGVSPLVCL